MNKKWQKEKDVLKKIQIHFTLKPEILKQLRYEAANLEVNPNDIIRDLIGLNDNLSKKKIRPRIGLSFNSQELIKLSKRYNVPVDNIEEIKSSVLAEVNATYKPNT